MVRGLVVISVAALAAAAMFPQAAAAQWGMPGGPMVSASGTASVKRMPDRLRLQWMISAKGKTMEEAVSALQKRREAAIAAMEKLGAEKKSIKFGPAGPSMNEQQRRQRLQEMVRARARSGAKKVKIPESVEIAAMLTAEWPLTEKEADRLLVSTRALQDKVKAVKLGGEEKVSEEEQEIMEEMEAEGPSFSHYGSGEGDPNAPMFLYVLHVADKDRAAATAEAFKKARAQAEELAAAAGAQLGELQALGVHASGRSMSWDSDMYPSSMSYRYAQRMAMMGGGDEGEDGERETVSPVCGEIVYGVNVQAAFKLAGAPGAARPAEK